MQPKLEPKLTNYDAMSGWKQDDHAEALAAFRTSCEVMLKQKDGAMQGKGLLAAPISAWKPVCLRAMRLDPAQARHFFEHSFVPFAPDDRDPHGLFTGYYEPLLYGSRTRKGGYNVPVYKLPPDVKSGVPYYTRAEIDAGALKDRKLELLWVNDEAALFFAHIQGSAQVQLPDGKRARIGYAGKNNRAYVALGKVLKEAGELEEVNMFTIRDWLKANPNSARRMMQENPSYVFFKELPNQGGPIGAQGVEVVRQRSLAIDPRFIPYGMPLFVQTMLPQTPYSPERPFNQLMIAQDTGGAIKGTVRGDIFFGEGREAEALAGMMKGRGTYILLLPASIAQGL
jgi:membrane-bound lytic murein transglycosylase A